MFMRLPRWWIVFPLAVGTAGRAADFYRPPHKDLGFPVYTNQPTGRQLSGEHAPATTPPLSPEEARARFTLPEGFEIRLFASEPEIVNPVAMTWDARGRLWVVELYEYPLGAPPGQKPRDRIKILEDTDADGRADKVHVWADGLNLATGILLGNGGAYVGTAPNLLFLQDTDGDDRADRRSVALTGFGLDDRHELLNGFTWGPDGWMYMTHGVFTRSRVQDPSHPDAPPVLLTAGVARFDPLRHVFEVFAEGTSNPWGVDFDRAGNAFVSACVIEHLFHMAPGGIYDRQAGTEPNPHAYERLHAINDHRHHMAAYAGVQIYQGDQFPSENLGTVLEGNIHDNAVHQDRLNPRGSSFVASRWRDLVRANDGWFMPVSTQVGPDGAVWIMDWYDRYPCYQNAQADPAGVDREYGRIWRVVSTGGQPDRPVPSRPDPGMDLSRLPGKELLRVLVEPNVWMRRMARRILTERHEADVAKPLELLVLDTTAPIETRLAALWTLHGSGQLADELIARASADAQAPVRAWAARLIGERHAGTDADLQILKDLAADPDPSVRLAVAVACRQFTSGALTVDQPPRHPEVLVAPVLAELVAHSAAGDDPVLPFMIWEAAEPVVAADPEPDLKWVAENGQRYLPLSAVLTRKLTHRICDLDRADEIDHTVAFLESLGADAQPIALAAIQGLLDGQDATIRKPARPVAPLVKHLSQEGNPKLADAAQRLGALWGDPESVHAVLARVADRTASVEDRLSGIQAVRRNGSEATRAALIGLLQPEEPAAIQGEALSALGALGGDDIAAEVLNRWKSMSPGTRRSAAGTLASRRAWALALLSAVRTGDVSASEFGAPVIRALLRHHDEEVRDAAKSAIGRYRESGADRSRLVARKRRVVLEGEPDLEAGHEVARRTCLVCHKLHGEGADVGPDLTGVGRSSLDALLWNVIDPNQIIGAGYEQVEVETRDDRLLTGRVVENNDQRVRLLMQGPKEEVVARADVVSQRTLDSSVMPEGLEQMPDADFRNLVWFILAPPAEGPLTDARRRALIGGGSTDDLPSASRDARIDHESVALWDPEWKVEAPDFEGTPARLDEYHGRKSILVTHPFDATRPAALVREVDVPADGALHLRFDVASHDLGDWTLRVLGDGRRLEQRIIGHEEPRWTTVDVDLAPFAGRRVRVRLENVANDWAWEFGYWANLRLGPTTQSASARADSGR